MLRMLRTRRMLAVAAKEVRQLARDRVTGGLIVGVPLMQMLLFGYAINFDVRHLEAAVLDAAHTSMSRQFVAELRATQVVDIVAYVRSDAELAELMRAGRVAVGVVIPAHFERRLQGNDRAALQLLVDGSQPSLAGVISGVAQMPMLQRHDLAVPANSWRAPLPRISVRTLYNPELRTAVQIVPTLIGVILSMTMVIFTAGAIVRERERGNLELLIATPLGAIELMIGKLLPFIAIGLIQVTLILLVGRYLFGVPIVGHLTDLYVAAMLFIAATLALGLFVSTLAKTQFQSFQLAFVTMLPSILLSGFMFPFAGMPRVAQWIAQVLPLTHFNVMVRGILLRGSGLAELWPQIGKLLIFFAIMMFFAVIRFQKRLD